MCLSVFWRAILIRAFITNENEYLKWISDVYTFDRLKMTPKDQYTVIWSNCYKTKTFLSGYVAWVWSIPASWICIMVSCFNYWSSAFLIKLAACRSLCLHVEDANFSEREFRDLLPICWGSCFKLVEEVQEFDSKVKRGFFITFMFALMRDFLFTGIICPDFHLVWNAKTMKIWVCNTYFHLCFRNASAPFQCVSPI